MALSISPISVPILQYLAGKLHGLWFEVLSFLVSLKNGAFSVFSLCFVFCGFQQALRVEGVLGMWGVKIS